MRARLLPREVTEIADVGDGPDVLALDPGLHRLYVASESGTLAVFDVGTGARKLAAGNAGPNAHSVSVDPATHLAFVPSCFTRSGEIAHSSHSGQDFRRPA
jgi:DNA-binding beta-propeller fold protein YncE